MSSDIIFMVLIAIMASNQFVIRSNKWKSNMWIFWVCQFSNVLFGSYMLLWGLPEFKNTFEIINILVGLLFLYHAVQNHFILQKFIRQIKIDSQDS
jgi:hypothetical protein